MRDFSQSEKKELSDDAQAIFRTIQEIRSEAQEIGSKKILELQELHQDNLPRKLKRLDLNKVTQAKVKELLLPLARDRSTIALGVKMRSQARV